MVSERDELPAKLPRVINTTTSTQKAMPFDRRMILLTLRSLVMGVSTKICEMISQVIVIIFLIWGKLTCWPLITFPEIAECQRCQRPDSRDSERLPQ